MQGDKVTVLVDRGDGKVVEHVLTATSPGGTVVVDMDSDSSTAGICSVEERSRGGNVRARVRVSLERLVSIVEEPAR